MGWKEDRKFRGRMHLKNTAVVTQEKGLGEGDPPVTFLITLYSSLTEWWGSQAVYELLLGLVCLGVPVCTVVVLWVSDLLEEAAAAMALCVF